VVTSTAVYAQKTLPPKGTATTGASAKFRVTLNGFAVNHQSDDDILEGDGKGDEVYLRADVWQINKDGAVSVKQPYRTPVLGDVNNQQNRKQAGSASDKGGLRTNDKYPTNTPWARGALQTLELPMLLWQGTLTQGEDGVSIIPTIWEWDSPNSSETETEWSNGLDQLFSSFQPFLVKQIQNRDIGITFYGTLVPPGRSLAFGSWDIGVGLAGTRPIGIYKRTASVPYLSYQMLPLNYDSALEATKTSPSNSGLGVFAIRYTDELDHGDYTLYLQVEKLN
jgi:hypothetical protein